MFSLPRARLLSEYVCCAAVLRACALLVQLLSIPGVAGPTLLSLSSSLGCAVLDPRPQLPPQPLLGEVSFNTLPQSLDIALV